MKKYDEYDVFKTTINKFKQTKMETFNLWQFSLSDKEKEVLNDMFSTIRVEINEKTIQSVPRKIIKIKRNYNNKDDLD